MRFLGTHNYNLSTQNQIDSDVIVCLDIDTREIRVTLIALSRPLMIVGFSRQLLNTSAETNYWHNLEGFEKAIKQTIDKSKLGQQLNLKYLVIGLSGHLIQSVTHLSRMRRFDEATPLDRKEISRLLAQNQTESLDIAIEEVRLNHQTQTAELQLLNSSLVNFNLDGTSLSDPLGKIGVSIGVTLYNVFIPTKWAQAIEQLAGRLDLDLISVAYKPFALAKGFLGNPQSLDVEALIIHVEALQTYVIIVSQGVLVKTEVFPIGSEHFNLSLCRNLKFDHKKVASLKDIDGDFSFSKLNNQTQNQALKIINHTTAVWLRGLFLSLKDMNLANLPELIYLSGKAAEYKIIKENLQRVDFNKIFEGAKQPNFENLTVDHLSKVVINLNKRLPISTLNIGIGLGQLAYDILEATNKLPLVLKE